MTSTPRTDEAWEEALRDASDSAEPLEFMRDWAEQLERELNASISENIRLHETIRQLRQELEELEHTRSLLNSIQST